MKRWVLAVVLGASAALSASLPALADDTLGGEVYESKCRSCHGEAGEGAGSFPALAGNPNLSDRSFVEETLENGRPGMPSYASLPPEELNGLVDYLVATFGGSSDASGSGSEQGGAQAGGGTTATTAAPQPLPPGDAARGEAYFLGESRLSNGGAACAACHAAGSTGGIGGGSLAADLTQVAQRFGGEAGVAGALQDPAFLVMRASYRDKALTDAERADLAAFFAAVASAETGGGRSFPGAFWLLSLLGTALLFVLMGLFWPRRGISPARRIRQG